MFILLKLWGVAMIAMGGYCSYSLVDNAFIKGNFSNFSNFLKIFSCVGILVGITLIWGGFKLLAMKRQK